MKRILFVIVCLAAAVGYVYGAHPDLFWEYAGQGAHATGWVWDGIRANPVPVSLAAGTFLLTVVYHKAKGKSLRESVEAAATRVTVVSMPAGDAAGENPVVRRARARATRAQLLADLNGLQNRQRKLPEEVTRAEKDACYTEQAVFDAERKLIDRRQAHEAAAAKLDAVRAEQRTAEAEVAAIEVELAKLAEVA
jgi:hypothetical protein